MTQSKKKRATAAYQELQSELSRVLYEEDPAGIGKTIGSPLDEYDGEAGRLAAALRPDASRHEIESVLEQLFHTRSTVLTERVKRAITKFRWKVASTQSPSGN